MALAWQSGTLGEMRRGALGMPWRFSHIRRIARPGFSHIRRIARLIILLSLSCEGLLHSIGPICFIDNWEARVLKWKMFPHAAAMCTYRNIGPSLLNRLIFLKQWLHCRVLTVLAYIVPAGDLPKLIPRSHRGECPVVIFVGQAGKR